MIRKAMIALAALTFVGAMTAFSTVDARAFGGGGIHAGGFGGGGLRAGFAGGAFRGGLVGPGRVAFRPGIGPRFGFRSGIGPRFGFRNRVFFANRFFPRRFARRFAFALCRWAFMAPRAGAGFRPLGAGSEPGSAAMTTVMGMGTTATTDPSKPARRARTLSG
jgi:hypothetical protein